MQIAHLFDFAQLRSISVNATRVCYEDLQKLIGCLAGKETEALGYAYISLQMRLAMSLIPQIPDSLGYNQRRRVVENFLTQKGFVVGQDFGSNELDQIVALCNRVADFKRRVRKSSWSDLHYLKQKELLDACNWRCQVCGHPFNLAQENTNLNRPEIDHVLPFIFGGNNPANLRLICRRCNTAKGMDIGYASVPSVSQNQFYKSKKGSRLAYWAFERDGSRCTTEGCSNTAHDSALRLLKVLKDGHTVFDNVRTVCDHCFRHAPTCNHPD